MSLYAVPGILVNPEDGPSLHPLYRVNDSNTYCDFAQAMSKRYNSDGTPKVRPQRVAIDCAKIVVDYSRLQSWKAKESMEITGGTGRACNKNNDNNVVATTSTQNRDNHLKIQVKDALIDFHKLTHSTTGGKVNHIKLPLRQQYHYHHGSSSIIYRSSSRLSRRKEHDQRNITILDPHENAIEFVLEISYVGRTYTAKRSLQQIVQLRNDLVEETNIQHHKSIRRGRKIVHPASDEHFSDEEYDDDGNESASTGRYCARSDSFEDANSVDSEQYLTSGSTIPELPNMSEKCLLGVLGCGFTKMKGRLHSYRPDLEQWFYAVIGIVHDDSPVLADFLWEPLSTESYDQLHEGLSKLLSIQESFGDIDFDVDADQQTQG